MAFKLAIFLLLAFFLPVGHFSIIGGCSQNREGSRCTARSTDWPHDGACLFDDKFKKTACHVPDSRLFFFKLVAVIIPREGHQPIDRLWIKGSGPGLSWKQSKEMKKNMKGYWSLDIKYRYDSNSVLCVEESQCTLNQRALEFRVYRDELALDDMIGPNIYIRLPISKSMSGSSDFSPPHVFCYPWFDGKKVVIKDYTLRSPLHFNHYNNFIRGQVFYPPSYDYNVLKLYPVVIVLGGMKNKLGPILESMYVYESNIEEAIILSVDNLFSAPYCEFNPFHLVVPNPSYYSGTYVFECTGSQDCDSCMNCFDPSRVEFCDAKEFSSQARRCGFTGVRCSGWAGAILDNIEYILLPQFSAWTMNRILIDHPKDRISIVGIDGGGLLACFAALSRPGVYKNAGCISASFHWPFRSLEVKENRKNQGIGLLLDEITERMKIRKELQVLHSSQKYYVDVGEHDNQLMPIVEAHNYSDWVVEQLAIRLKLDPENLLYFRNVLGGKNSVKHLKQFGDYRMIERIKVPLLFFLKPEGGLNEDYPRMPKISSQDYIDRQTKGTSHRSISIEELNKMAKDTKVNCEDLIQAKSVMVSVPRYLLSVGKSIPNGYDYWGQVE